MTKEEIRTSINEDNIIATIEVEGKKLVIFYSKWFKGLYSYFNSDEEMRNYLKDNSESVFKEFIEQAKIDDEYWLNIASTDDFCYFKFKGSSSCQTLLLDQLIIFRPLIERFITHAKQGTF